MKKVLIVVLTVVLLLSVFVFGSSASTLNTNTSYSYNGVELADLRQFPEVQTYNNSSYCWVLTKSSSYYILIISEYPLYFNSNTDKMQFFGIPSDAPAYSVNHIKQFKLYPNDNGVYKIEEVSAGYVDNNSTFGTSSNFVWTSYDIYRDKSSDIFMYGDTNFEPPLHLQMAEVVEGILTMETVPTLGGMMRVIALCGVGCLACLISLRLFGKVSQIFRLKS